MSLLQCDLRILHVYYFPLQISSVPVVFEGCLSLEEIGSDCETNSEYPPQI